jgi:tape measure domain-containing protein
VNKAFVVSGAGADEASNAIRQLVQAFQSGVLRGDEFNSMMENAPRLAKLLSDSLGIPIGQLRKMAEEGELTSDKLVKAFSDRKFTEGLDEEFKKLPVTFSQAMTQVETAAIQTFGAFDRGGQFSTAIANFVSDGAKGFADLGGAAEKFGADTSVALAGVFQIFSNLIGEVNRLSAAIASIPLIGSGINSSFLPAAQAALNPLGTLVQMSPAYQRGAQDRRNELAMGSIKGSVADWTRSNADNQGRWGARGGWWGNGRASSRPAIAAPKAGGGSKGRTRALDRKSTRLNSSHTAHPGLSRMPSSA